MANVSPTVSRPLPDTTVSEDFGKVFIRALTDVFSDADLDSLTFTDSSFSGGVMTMISNDSLYLLSQPNFFGNAAIRITASDSEFTVADTFLVTISSVNDPPIVNNPIADRLLNKNFGSVFVSELSQNFTDVDLFTVLTYGATNLGPGVTPRISNDSLYLEDSLNFAGSVLIRVTASDADTSVADTFQVTVQETRPTVIAAISDTLFSEDAGTLTVVSNLYSVFQDIDTPDLGFTVSVSGNGITADIVGNELDIITQPDSFGVYPVVITATDELSQSASDTFVVTITPVNDAPRIISALADGSVNEDVGKKFIAKMTSTFGDPDGDSLTYTASVSDPAKLSTLISGDSLYIMTIKDSNGVVAVYVSAEDPSSASVQDTFLLTINPVSDPPFVAQAMPDTTFQQDFGRLFIFKLSNYFFDYDNTTLNYAAYNLSEGACAEISNDSLYLNSQTYFFGNVDIVVEADDGSQVVADTFLVTVNNVNDAPISLNWFTDITIDEDTPGFFVGGINYNFAEVDNDALIYDAASSDTTKLTLRLSNDSLYAYPVKDSSGTVEIYLSATDPYAAVGRDTFLITIDPVNDAPRIVSAIRDTSLMQNFGKVFIRKLSTVFTDIDSPVLTYAVDSLSPGVSRQISSDSLYIQSIPGFFGSVNIRVSANDGSLTTSDTFKVVVNDNVNPTAFVNALASPVLNVVRFVAGADENLRALTLTANGIPVTMIKQSSVYFGDYNLLSTGSLTVSVSATDLSGNQDTVARQYQVSLLNKPASFATYRFTGSSEGYLLLARGEDTQAPANWKRFGENINVITTGYQSELHVEAVYERSVSLDEEAKIGLYEFRNNEWAFVGGEGATGKVVSNVENDGQYAVFYNPDHVIIPKAFVLNQNYPNPFNPSTTIRYEVPFEAHVTLTIYNVLGQEVKTLVNGVKGIGRYEVQWNGQNQSGRSVASGIYLLRFNSGAFVQTKKMLLIK